MDDRLYRSLKITAITLTLSWLAWSVYEASRETEPGERLLAAAVRQLEDRHFEEALELFRESRAKYPENLGAVRGEAQALMELGAKHAARANTLRRQGDVPGETLAIKQSLNQYKAALAAYDEAIQREEVRGITDRNRRIQGVAYANRGILKDRMGDYRGALADYEAAIRLEPEVAEGPGFLTRFMRNQAERPPSVTDRAKYIREQLERPPAERLLKIPEEDARQRAYPL